MPLQILMGKMVVPLGWGTLSNQPRIHLISRGVFIGYIPFAFIPSSTWTYDHGDTGMVRSVRQARQALVDLEDARALLSQEVARGYLGGWEQIYLVV